MYIIYKKILKIKAKKYFLIIFLLYFSQTSYADKAPWAGQTLDGTPCTGRTEGHGPFDYLKRNEYIHDLNLVESAHFPPKTENLVEGNTAKSPIGDIEYTLRAWPNHHRALLSIIRYQLNYKNGLLKEKLPTPPECYLQRAIKFSKNDAASHSLYGYYLSKIGKKKDARNYYEKAMKIDPSNDKIAYSYSFLLLDLNEYDEALKYAKVAYQQKGTPEGLRKKLVQLGVWQE